MNQKLFEFLSDNGFTPMMSDYEEIRHLMSLEHCTANERAFLDEIREKGEWIKSAMPGADAIWFDYSCIRQSDFKTPLEGLVDEPKKEKCPLCLYPYDSVEHETSCQLFGG